jgi:hypothetical protein
MFRQPRTYHATVQLLHVLVVAFKIRFYNPLQVMNILRFPVALNNPLKLLKC